MIIEAIKELLLELAFALGICCVVAVILLVVVLRILHEEKVKYENRPVIEDSTPPQIQTSRNIGGIITEIREIRSAVYGKPQIGILSSPSAMIPEAARKPHSSASGQTAKHRSGKAATRFVCGIFNSRYSL